MSFTGTDVINRAGDAASGLTVDGTKALRWINDAINLVIGKRTDANFDENGDYIETFTALTAAGDTVPLDDDFITSLVYYVAGQVFLSDSESAKHQAQAKEMLGLSGLVGGR